MTSSQQKKIVPPKKSVNTVSLQRISFFTLCTGSFNPHARSNLHLTAGENTPKTNRIGLEHHPNRKWENHRLKVSSHLRFQLAVTFFRGARSLWESKKKHQTIVSSFIIPILVLPWCFTITFSLNQGGGCDIHPFLPPAQSPVDDVRPLAAASHHAARSKARALWHTFSGVWTKPCWHLGRWQLSQDILPETKIARKNPAK